MYSNSMKRRNVIHLVIIAALFVIGILALTNFRWQANLGEYDDIFGFFVGLPLILGSFGAAIAVFVRITNEKR